MSHELELRDDAWALGHPPACREAGSLLDCPVHRPVVELMAQSNRPPLPVGRYHVDLDENGELYFVDGAS